MPVLLGHRTTAVDAEDVNSPVKLEGEVLENKDKMLRLDRVPRGWCRWQGQSLYQHEEPLLTPTLCERWECFSTGSPHRYAAARVRHELEGTRGGSLLRRVQL